MANMKPNICGNENIYIPDEECDCCDVLQEEIDEIWERIGQGVGNVLVNTTEYWNSNPALIGEKDIVYVYTDHITNDDEEPIPAYKVGDGLAFLIDLPFSDDILLRHINNNVIHITQAEREFWNNKVTAYIDALDLENLVLSNS